MAVQVSFPAFTSRSSLPPPPSPASAPAPRPSSAWHAWASWTADQGHQLGEFKQHLRGLAGAGLLPLVCGPRLLRERRQGLLRRAREQRRRMAGLILENRAPEAPYRGARAPAGQPAPSSMGVTRQTPARPADTASCTGRPATLATHAGREITMAAEGLSAGGREWPPASGPATGSRWAPGGERLLSSRASAATSPRPGELRHLHRGSRRSAPRRRDGRRADAAPAYAPGRWRHPGGLLAAGTVLTVTQRRERQPRRRGGAGRVPAGGDHIPGDAPHGHVAALGMHAAWPTSVQSEEFDVIVVRGTSTRSTPGWHRLRSCTLLHGCRQRGCGEPGVLPLVEPPPAGAPAGQPAGGAGADRDHRGRTRGPDGARRPDFIDALETLEAVDDVNLVACPDRINDRGPAGAHHALRAPGRSLRGAGRTPGLEPDALRADSVEEQRQALGLDPRLRARSTTRGCACRRSARASRCWCRRRARLRHHRALRQQPRRAQGAGQRDRERRPRRRARR